MSRLSFKGFKKFCEQGSIPPPDGEPGKGKSDFEKSNMDGIFARDLNIVPGSNDKAMDMVSPGSAIEFKGHKLKNLNSMLGIEGADTAIKTIRVVRRNEYGVQIEDVTGGCDKQGLNTGPDSGRFAGQPFPHAACSPTHGQKWWISAKDWDSIRMPLPSGGGAAGGAPPL